MLGSMRVTSTTCSHCDLSSVGRCVTAPRPTRRTSVTVRAQDAFCKDKISTPKAPAVSKGATFQLTFQGAGGQTKVIQCADNKYILDAADAQGLDLPATCRGGICGSCVARLASGGVDQSDVDDLSFTLTQEEQDQGMVLLCMARPTADCSFETQSDWGYSLGIGEWTGATGKFTSTPAPLMGALEKK